MQRQSHLLTLPHNPFFCFPESVGNYWNHPQHYTLREAGALNNFNIHYVASGKGCVEWDGEVHTLEAGEAVLYFPLQRQHYYSSTEDPWDIRWVHFYGNGLQDYMIERGFHKSQLWTIRNRAAWEQAHEELLVEAETHRMLHPNRLSALTYAILAVFVEQAIPISGSKSSSSSNRIAELLPLMQQEAAQPFILEHWAGLAGVSPHYFCKLFRSVMEMTPMDFITRCRLQMAKQWLLERKETPIGQIAADAGYPSVSYFNKRFMEHEDMTPTVYRQLYGL
ncbi:AraC family transcriptional regulator [Paenibacillus alkaliterrae]|uniref:helix-turn-helix transcriptional regulator n=1 Tax=Paenibacillus alkaliterrae TaxID=320909 RepID=UPI001F45A9BC|nr:AraC family transcriptional regulator [Paenibacillus alkaliterrae]MCF2940070.1 AraC family transcriptional regulator [Paenibacillus alkaliterrae]